MWETWWEKDLGGLAVPVLKPFTCQFADYLAEGCGYQPLAISHWSWCLPVVFDKLDTVNHFFFKQYSRPTWYRKPYWLRRGRSHDSEGVMTPAFFPKGGNSVVSVLSPETKQNRLDMLSLMRPWALFLRHFSPLSWVAPCFSATSKPMYAAK